MSVTERGHLSIGEVLSLLQTEFPDVTISKIRFLESQGLIDPERTPSGYRKFYDADIDRLRWILIQQRDHFLPLKVIKDRLDDAAALELPIEGLARPTEAPAAAPADVAAPDEPASRLAAATGPSGEATDATERAVAPGVERHGDGGPADRSIEEAEAGAETEAEAETDEGADDGSARATVGAGAGRLVGASGSRAPMFNAFSGSSNQARPAMAAARPERAGGDDGGHRAAQGAPERSAGSPPDDASAAPTERMAEPAAAAPQAEPSSASGLRDPVSSAAEPVDRADTAPATGPDAPAASTAPGAGSPSAPASEPNPAATDRGAPARPTAGTGGAEPGDDQARDSGRRRSGRARRAAGHDVSSVSFTADELASAVGLDLAAIAELERYGLISPRQLSQGPRYGDDALLVARLAARFAAYGIEARHLRMFRVAVEREQALYEQVISPLSRSRDDSREVRAAEIWSDLDQLGADLRDALFHRGPL